MAKFERILIASIVACFTLLAILFFLMIKEDRECTSSGGKWVGTGEYQTTTTFISSGESLIPMTTTTETRECVKVGSK